MKSNYVVALFSLLLLSSANGNAVKSRGAHSAFEPILASLSDYSSGTSIQSVCNGHLVVDFTAEGDYLQYNNVDFGAGAESVMIVFADGNNFGKTGKIQFRLDYPNAEVFGEVTVGQTGDWCNFVTLNSVLDVPPNNVHTLYATYATTNASSCHLEWFQFNSTIF